MQNNSDFTMGRRMEAVLIASCRAGLVIVVGGAAAVGITQNRAGTNHPRTQTEAQGIAPRGALALQSTSGSVGQWTFYVVETEMAAAALRSALEESNVIRSQNGLSPFQDRVLVAESPAEAERIVECLEEGNRILASLQSGDRIVNLAG